MFESDFEQKELLKLRVPEALNYEKRFFGFPTDEFLFLLFPMLVLMKINLLYGLPYSLALYVLGKVRARKPYEWFRYLPYLWLKLPYKYLVKPGRRTYLP